ncbi:MAG: LolA family protein [Polyangiales bacterium]
MKRSTATPLAAALILALAAVPTGSDAQDRPSARTVAGWVENFHDQTSTFQARFHQTYYHGVYQRYQRSKGKMAFEKPGKMRFDYARPNGKVIASDGDELTVYEPGDDGEPGQYTQNDIDDATLPSAFSFLTGMGELDADFRFRLLNADRWGWRGELLELRPKKPNARYKRVILFVDSREQLRGVVHKIRIDDHDGNRNKFELGGMKFNREIDGSRFAFRPPSDAHRVQM